MLKINNQNILSFRYILCLTGEPLTDPSPRYDNQKDRMMCHVNATFGRSGWQLPVVEIEFPSIPDVYRWFAVCLLDGLVVKKLKKFVKSLLSPPSTMIKSWAKLQPRTETLYRALILKQIRNKTDLSTEWKQNPTCKFIDKNLYFFFFII